MTTPQAFTVQAVPSEPVPAWKVTDPLVEALWLPLLGPTSWALLRHIDGALSDQAEYFAPVTFRTADVADALFVKPNTVAHSLDRLRRFGLLAEDDITTSYEHPVMLSKRTVPVIGPKQWRRLPASVREKFASVQL